MVGNGVDGATGPPPDSHAPPSPAWDGELARVHGLAAYMAVELGCAVTPVLCPGGSGASVPDAPLEVGGVWVVPGAALRTWVAARSRRVDEMGAALLLACAAAAFPAAQDEVRAAQPIAYAGGGRRRGRRSPPRRDRVLPDARDVLTADRVAPARSDAPSPVDRILRYAAVVIGVALLAAVLASGAAWAWTGRVGGGEVAPVVTGPGPAPTELPVRRGAGDRSRCRDRASGPGPRPVR